jgi:hypothetical protein
VQKILARLSEQGLRIRDVATLREEVFSPTLGRKFRYIEIGDVAANTLVSSVELLGEDAPSRAKNIVRGGDVIASTVRPIRRLSGLIAREQDGWVCSSGFAVLRPHGVSPEYLVAYLRLPPVCELMDAYTTATMYPAISVPDLLNMPFYQPDDRLVTRLCETLRHVRTASGNAERKLEEARRLIEAAIATQR